MTRHQGGWVDSEGSNPARWNARISIRCFFKSRAYESLERVESMLLFGCCFPCVRAFNGEV